MSYINVFVSFYPYRKKKSNWRELVNTLSPIDVEDYTTAVPGSCNEVSLLLSTTDHPAVWSAEAVGGNRHEIVAIYNSIYGGKSCSVKPIQYSHMSSKNSIVVDLGNGKVVTRSKPKFATDTIRKVRMKETQESKHQDIVDAAVKDATSLFLSGKSISFDGTSSKFLIPHGIDWRNSTAMDDYVTSTNINHKKRKAVEISTKSMDDDVDNVDVSTYF